MFGTNKISEPFLDEKGALLINEIFYTLQGEGPDAGRPAVFIRLKGCNLRCHFCDTEFEQGGLMQLGEVLDRVLAIKKTKPALDLVVITGGEPLLQNIFPLVHTLNSYKMQCTVETAGTVWVRDLDYLFKADRNRSPYGNAIICSPKTPKVHADVARAAHAIKYIVHHGATSKEDGLPTASTQISGAPSLIARPDQFNPLAQVYVQPMDTGDQHKNRLNQLLASSICMEHGYRLSIQLHKLVDLP